jgi:SAM-dependent methyltransferase
VAKLINAASRPVILDVGGGKECPFLPHLENPDQCLIVAIDISENELRTNKDVRNRVIADASATSFPFAPAAVDFIASRSVVEHLPDVARFFANCAEVLRPGGYAIHTFPCKYAPFALLNRILPNRMAQRILYFAYPEWEAVCGFPAHYDHCCYSEIMRLADDCGLQVVRVEIRYYQAIYYTFFFPLYLIILAYDLTIYFLDTRDLACQLLVFTRRMADRTDRQGSSAAAASVPAE